MLKPKTIILLIDFEGHPILGDDMTNNLRYSYLKSLIFNDAEGDIYDLLVVSDHAEEHPKMTEIQRMSEIEGRHTWININPDRACGNSWIDGEAVENFSIQTIIDKVAEYGYEIQNVVVGGCNTNGCVFNSTSYSSAKWAHAGYPVQIMLPMCADYQLTGLDMIEVNIMAFSGLYTQIKEHGLFNLIDINARFTNLNLEVIEPN
jgi:hypothetical protein